MKYCLDTSVFTQAHRQYYAIDIAPKFWKSIEKLARDQIIVSPVAVHKEIMDIDDELKTWAKNMDGILCVDPDEKVLEAYQQVAEFANARYRDGHWIREFLDGADAWVVAQAKAHDLTVVSMEGRKSFEDIDRLTRKYIGKIKIPNMCGHFGVKSISTFDLVRTLKIELG